MLTHARYSVLRRAALCPRTTPFGLRMAPSSLRSSGAGYALRTPLAAQCFEASYRAMLTHARYSVLRRAALCPRTLSSIRNGRLPSFAGSLGMLPCSLDSLRFVSPTRRALRSSPSGSAWHRPRYARPARGTHCARLWRRSVKIVQVRRVLLQRGITYFYTLE